ncbi:MAG TPA: DNA polymerase III subunit delta [Bacteroidales bacterium]|nr:DNA polymerase III subunit delta [Bacteroidales bacterium]HRZ77854.1 DNA polymerase III subunit delta [Bacteroidales bacterium]
MTFDQIITDLRNKIYHPVYFLMGEESYYIDVISDIIEEEVLSPAEKGFNLTVLYGRDSSLAQVVALARNYPMMANYQVIIVREAQDLFRKQDHDKLQALIKAQEGLETPRNRKIAEQVRELKLVNAAEAARRLGMDKPSDQKVLEEVFGHMGLIAGETGKGLVELLGLLDRPVKSTILVFAYKYEKLDRRKAFAKKLEKSGVLFESVRLYDNKVPEWIAAYLRKKGYGIEIPTTVLLAEYLGNDLSRIANELEKLVINLPKGSKVNSDHVEANIGISKEYNIFELQKALGAGDTARAQRIVNHFAANARENPAVKTIAILFSWFSKLLILHSLTDRNPNSIASALSINPYFVKDYQQAAQRYSRARLEYIIQLLQSYDMKSKGLDNASADDGELTRELIFRIMH